MIAAQLIGLAGFAVILAATQFRERKLLLLVDALGIALVAVHWVLLSEAAGAALNGVYLLVNVAALVLVTEERAHRAYLAVYPIALIAVALTFESAVDLLALAGTLLSAVAKHTARMDVLRRALVASGLCWGVFGALEGSAPQVAFSVLFVTGHVLGLRRLGYGEARPAAVP